MSRIAAFTLLLFLLFCCSGSSVAQETTTRAEQHSAIVALTRLFGEPTDGAALAFDATPYVITPTFSKEGLLLSLRIELNPRVKLPNLSRSDFDRLLVLVDSVKPIGKYEENGGGISHGGRAYLSNRYDFAYLRTAEPIIGPQPPPVVSALISYLHPVSGVAKLPAASKPSPGFVCSFCEVCVDGEAYTAPNVEFQRVQLRPNEVQQLNLAGPSQHDSACKENSLDSAKAGEKPKAGDEVLLVSMPADYFEGHLGARNSKEGDALSDFSPEDQEAITAVVGKAVRLVGYDDQGRAEVQFTDAHGRLHLLYVEPNQIRAMEPAKSDSE